MTAHTELLLPALEAALAGKQLQPVILSHEKSHQRSQLSVSVPKCDSNSALLSAAESTLTVHTAENSLSSPCTAVNGGDYTCAE